MFVFNFHPTQSYTDYRIGVNVGGKYRIILDSDALEFGGHNRLDHSTDYFTFDEGFAGRQYSMMVIKPLDIFSLFTTEAPPSFPLYGARVTNQQDPDLYNLSDNFALHEGYTSGAEPPEHSPLKPRYHVMVPSVKSE